MAFQRLDMPRGIWLAVLNVGEIRILYECYRLLALVRHVLGDRDVRQPTPGREDATDYRRDDANPASSAS